MRNEELIKAAIREDSVRAHHGIYWYGAQNGRLLFRDKKNIAVGNFYTIVSILLNALNQVPTSSTVIGQSGTDSINVAGTYTSEGGGSYQAATTITAKVTNIAVANGTDTTTPTTQTMNTLVTVATGQIATSITAETGYIAIVATTPAGSIGTRVIGEIGVQIQTGGTSVALLSRIAVADGANLGNGSGNTVTVQTQFAYTFTAVIYL
jgi:hypothetical protein